MKEKGITGENLYRKLESRMDNMVYRSGFAVSRAQARQFIRQGRFLINDRNVNIPSQQLKPDDVIKPVDFGKIQLREGFVLPEWLSANVKEKYVKFIREPAREDVSERIDLPLIIEYYSR